MRERKIDFLEEKVKRYYLQIGQQSLSDKQIKEVFAMITICSHMETIGDIIERNLDPLLQKKKNLELDFSQEGRNELIAYHKKVCKQLSRLEKTFSEMDPVRAGKVIEKEEKYMNLEEVYRTSHLQRMHDDRQESLKTHEVHTELMEIMKQINVYTGEIAKLIYNLNQPESN